MNNGSIGLFMKKKTKKRLTSLKAIERQNLTMNMSSESN